MIRAIIFDLYKFISDLNLVVFLSTCRCGTCLHLYSCPRWQCWARSSLNTLDLAVSFPFCWNLAKLTNILGKGPHFCAGPTALRPGRTAFHYQNQGCPITIISSAVIELFYLVTLWVETLSHSLNSTLCQKLGKWFCMNLEGRFGFWVFLAFEL